MVFFNVLFGVLGDLFDKGVKFTVFSVGVCVLNIFAEWLSGIHLLKLRLDLDLLGFELPAGLILDFLGLGLLSLTLTFSFLLSLLFGPQCRLISQG